MNKSGLSLKNCFGVSKEPGPPLSASLLPVLTSRFLSFGIKVVSTNFFISTNATVFSPEIVSLMNVEGNTLQLSYDGLDQDKLRGLGSIVRENIQKYVHHMDKGDLTVRMTYTPETVDHLYENIVHMHDLGFTSVMHSAEYSDKWTLEHLEEYENQLNKIYDFLKGMPTFRLHFADCKSVKITKADVGCKMGKQMVAISADGDIYPCHRAVAHKDLKIGNVHEERLNRGVFLTLRMDGCDTCPAKGMCSTCFVANYEYGKSLTAMMPCTCSINLAQFRKAAEVYEEVFGGDDLIKDAMIPLLKDIFDESKLALILLNDQ